MTFPKKLFIFLVSLLWSFAAVLDISYDLGIDTRSPTTEDDIAFMWIVLTAINFIGFWCFLAAIINICRAPWRKYITNETLRSIHMGMSKADLFELLGRKKTHLTNLCMDSDNETCASIEVYASENRLKSAIFDGLGSETFIIRLKNGVVFSLKRLQKATSS